MKKYLLTIFSILIVLLGVSCRKETDEVTTPSTTPNTTPTITNTGEDEEDNSFPLDDTSYKGYNFTQQTATNSKVTYELLKMQNSYMKELGVSGDGCQWEVALESSKTGDLMLYGLDVAGMYRSLDHGATWEMCNKGFINRGAGMFAIDPYNSSHVLALGIGNNSNGIHISLDKACTFTPTFSIIASGHRYFWDGLEFDQTTYDSSINETTDVYFSTPYQRDRANRLNTYTLPALNSKLSASKAGLYKSVDGGRSFTQISNNPKLADGIVKVTEDGNIFIGNQHGLFHVSNEGEILHSWLLNEFSDYNEYVTISENKVLKCNLGITGLDSVGNTIYAQTWDGIYKISTSSFETSKIESENYPSANWAQFIEVSESNPNHMILQARKSISGNATIWSTYVHTSVDGGKTWTKAEADANSFFTGGSWNGREKLFIIDPSNDNTVISFASDTLAISKDLGYNFIQVSGISNMMSGGKIHPNYYNPNLFFFGAQDYTSVLSLDGGETWKRMYVNVDGTSYGNLYGAFAADSKTFYGFADVDWYDEHKLVVTYDGGKTWTDTGFVSDTAFENANLSSMQSFNNSNILFAGAYYSKDRGYTWKKMNGCSMVYEINYTGKHEIYGTNDKEQIVVSYDDGDTWTVIFDKVLYNYPTRVGGYIGDIAYDYLNNYLYVIDFLRFQNNTAVSLSTKVYKIDLNTNEYKEIKVKDDPNGYELYRSVDVDPNAVNVVYVCGLGSSFTCTSSLQRSIDGGESFSVLTASGIDNLSNNIGGYEVSTMFVNPFNGELVYGSGCYGFGKVNAPYTTKLNHKIVSHKINYIYDNQLIKDISTYNLELLEDYIYDIDGYTFKGWYFDKECMKPIPDKFMVDNSYNLYAKLEVSEKIYFYVGNNLLTTIDIDEGLDVSKFPNPQKDGYTFAGWYTSLENKEKFDYKEHSTNVEVFAGFYKTSQNIYDKESQDMATYIRYDDHKITVPTFVSNEEDVDNRLAYIELDKNKEYLISFKMTNRARIGMTNTSFWQYNAVPYYQCDSSDTNTLDIVNMDVYFTVSTSIYNKLVLFYYTKTDGVDFKDIKASISVYEIIDNALYS